MPEILSPKIIRSNRRTLSLQVNPDLSITVKAPLFISVHDINSFIHKNVDWIKNRTTQLQQKRTSTKDRYENGSQILFLGKSYTFTVGNYSAITLEDDKFL